MFLNSSLSTMTSLGSGYLVLHPSSTRIGTISAWTAETVHISIQPVVGSIIVVACRYTDLPDLI